MDIPQAQALIKTNLDHPPDTQLFTEYSHLPFKLLKLGWDVSVLQVYLKLFYQFQ